MNLIEQTIKNIKPLDEKSMQLATKRQDSMVKPPKSFGILEKITIQLAGIYKNPKLSQLKKAILIFGSDNDVYEENLSKDKQGLTAEHFPNFVKNYCAIGSICEYTNTKVLAIDVGIKTDEKLDGIIDEKIAKATRNMTKGPAMTVSQAEQSIEIGIKYANFLINQGYNMIFLGEMGIANTTPPSAIISCVTGKDPKDVTGRGSGINDELLKNKINAIKKALEINKPKKDDYMDILTKIGGFETGAMLGAILACSANNIPIMLDGLITYSATILAKLANPLTMDYVLPSHITREKAGKYALEYLELNPPLDIDMCLGEGYGAVLYSQIIDGAIYSYNTMKTFDELKMVTDK